jgi:hypothetical protein
MKLLSSSLAVLLLAGGLSTGALAETRRTYIVQLAAEPAASYNGTIASLPATRPTPGTRFDARSAAVKSYSRFLNLEQRSVMSLVSKAPIVARYSVAFNGFAARLTDAEVQTLRADPRVVQVHVDVARQLTTISTPTFLGLTAPGGIWSQSAGGTAVKGEDIIIGIIDSGVWPESPSYADQVDGSGNPVFTGGVSAYGPPSGWTGTCQAGEGFVPAQHCNNKLIGAQFFNAGFLSTGLVQHWTEFTSPRDSAGIGGKGGHGSHTSSTAGGNGAAPVVLSGVPMGSASGIAPRARVAVYKVCWTYVDLTNPDGSGNRNSCYNSDSVAAIDKAVADGVHVINYSISGSQTSVNDPVEQAFLRASNAGVFVAASAGNSGPGNAVAHVSPWLTTVAASTHDRALTGNVTLGNGATYSGASINTTPLAAKPMIRAEDAGLPGVDATQLRLCYLSPTVLDPAKVAGKVVVCDRGTIDRVAKSAAVKAAGGLGMVMVDNGAGLVADIHAVPTVHVNATDGAIIKAYAATAGSTAAISAFYNGSKPAPIIADFSSRGPNQGDANMLKPDLTAPGVDVIATVTPNLTQAENDAVAAGTLVPPAAWASYQGTSMSSPHVAGLATLLKQARPTWSPAAIKSALMTSAYSTLNDGLSGMQNGLLPWAQGAGHVDPNKAVDPGLVYDAGPVDFIRYQCKVNRAAVPAADCTTYGTLDETYNHNLPSITAGAITGAVTITRRVTNVGASAATYSSSVSVPGFTAVVNPASLSLDPGETKSFTLTLTDAGAATNVWNYGALTWTDGTHVVRSPVTARAGVAITALSQVNGNTVSGSRLITVRTAFTGRMTANKGGLKDVTLGPVTALAEGFIGTAQAIANACINGGSASVAAYPIVVPAGTIVVRVALRNEDMGVATDDNDLVLLRPDNSIVAYSGNVASSESIQLSSPAPGTYKACVHAYAGSSSMTHQLSSWVVTPADQPGNFNVMLPSKSYSGGTSTVGLSWKGLAMGGRYVGGVQFKDLGGVVQATTAVRVEPNGGLPLSGEPIQMTLSK